MVTRWNLAQIDMKIVYHHCSVYFIESFVIGVESGHCLECIALHIFDEYVDWAVNIQPTAFLPKCALLLHHVSEGINRGESKNSLSVGQNESEETKAVRRGENWCFQ